MLNIFFKQQKITSLIKLHNISKKYISQVYQTKSEGQNFEFRIKLYNNKNEQISFWKDIPLQNDQQQNVFNVCIEIPQNQLAKLELEKKEKYHPIKQDTRKNKFNKSIQELRYYAQFPLFNYGFIPQTWENNVDKNQEGFLGDNDPLDVCDLSETKKNVADIYQAKVLGSFCLIDEGEVDWKILCIDLSESIQKNIRSLDDIDKLYPGRLNAIKNWFKYIKTFDGKKSNTIHYDEKIFDQQKTINVIKENHDSYNQLLTSNKFKDQALKFNLLQ